MNFIEHQSLNHREKNTHCEDSQMCSKIDLCVKKNL
jgi:hypothetical protein